MNRAHLVHVVGLVLLALSPALGLSGLVSLAYGDGDVWAFVVSGVLVGGIGYAGYRRTTLERDLSVREGYAVVSLAWLAVGAAGALPYYLSGAADSFVAALFESVSGFTTTGATIYADIEALPHGVLFWRALTQWLGGMGIIVLGIAILPFLGVGGMQLFRAEVPGPTVERLQPRIAQTAKLLWYVYAGMTAAQVLLLLLGGLSPFDAVTHAFTTLSTGGFSTRNASIAAFDSRFVQYTFILFMYLAGINFALHYRFLSGQPRTYLLDAEWKFYTAVLAGAALVIAALALAGGGMATTATGTGAVEATGSAAIPTAATGAAIPTAATGAAAQGGPGAFVDHVVLERTLRDALFQAVSIGTTTGYVTYDYEIWAAGAQVMLLLLMFIGGMAGSTAGGMKAMRVAIFFRLGLTELRKSLHPRAVIATRLGRRAIHEDVLLNILAFVLLFIGLFAAGALLLAALGHDIVTAIGASAASIGNIGPGLGAVGAIDNYGWMDPISHLLLVFLMLVGRLEIFTILLLFHPDLWRAPRRTSRAEGRPPSGAARSGGSAGAG